MGDEPAVGDWNPAAEIIYLGGQYTRMDDGHPQNARGSTGVRCFRTFKGQDHNL